jgi:hypothetical protein
MGTDGRSLNDPFKNDTGVTTEVDIPSLEAEVTRLESLRDYLSKTLIPHLGTVGTTIKDGKVAFGGFAQAQAAAQKHDSYFQTVTQAYASIVKQLDDDIQATRAIIDNYTTADARNQANVADIDKLFHNDPGAAGTYSTSSTPYTGSTSSTSSTSSSSGSGL